MNSEEKKQWDELYQYVKKEILQYDDNQKIPDNLILRLKGLSTGKLIENKSIEDKAKYSYEIVLYTFKLCKTKILYAIKDKEFKDEMSKFIYICAIIDNNINDVYLRVTNAKKSQEKTESINVENLNHDGAEYQSKSKDISNEKLKDLW
jgi:hypothetical protein